MKVKTKVWLVWVVWSIIDVGLLPYANLILPSTIQNSSIHSLQMYVRIDCPYAQSVIPLVITWQQDQENVPIYFYEPTPFFPSPTLRIQRGDYYENYLGEKAIKNALNRGEFA